MKKVVILGAGLATRLYPITHHIPKVLVNYGQHTILKHLYDLYQGLGAEEIIVVVHSKFLEITQGYAKMNNLNVRFVCVDEAYGSAYAISKIDDIQGHDVVFNWCDVIPTFKNFHWNEDRIYTHGNECRYKLVDGEIKNVGQTGGNIVGIYQCSDFKIERFTNIEQANEYFRGRDFIDFFEGTATPNEGILSNLVDLGDMPKLINAHKEMGVIPRDFNKVEITENMVYKSAVNEKGITLQKIEYDWYMNVESNSVPTIYNYRGEGEGNMISMERIKGQELSKCFENADLEKLFKALDFAETTFCPTDGEYYRDMKFEIIDKVVDRCKSIEPLTQAFGKINYVNGIKIGRLEPMLKRAFAHLVAHHENRIYSVIHGDPNFSNTFKTNDGEIKFIDPRGYFGMTQLFGPKMYDVCKVLYALTGYDKFNSDETWGGLSVSENKLKVEIEPLVEGIFESKEFTDLERLWVAVIWIALGGYFKNNPLKAYSAYYYGMLLLTEMLKKLGRKLTNGETSKDLPNGRCINALLTTKNPGKWLLIDLETGQQYKPNPEPGQYWSKI